MAKGKKNSLLSRGKSSEASREPDHASQPQVNINYFLGGDRSRLSDFFSVSSVRAAEKALSNIHALHVGHFMNCEPRFHHLNFSLAVSNGNFSRSIVRDLDLRIFDDGTMLLPPTESDRVLATILVLDLIQRDLGSQRRYWSQSVAESSDLLRSLFDKKNPPINLVKIAVHAPKLTPPIVALLGPGVALLESENVVKNRSIDVSRPKQKPLPCRSDIDPEFWSFLERFFSGDTRGGSYPKVKPAIHFYFSDGVVLNEWEILAHPYSILLDGDLLLRRHDKSDRDAGDDFSWRAESGFPMVHSVVEEYQAVAIYRICEFGREAEIPVFMTASPLNSSGRVGWPLRGIQTPRSVPDSWSVIPVNSLDPAKCFEFRLLITGVRFDHGRAAEDIVWFDSLSAYDRKSGVFSESNFAGMVRKISLYSDGLSADMVIEKSATKYQVEVLASADCEGSLRKWNMIFAVCGMNTPLTMPLTPIEVKDYTAELHLFDENADDFAISHRITTENFSFRLPGFPPIVNQALEAATVGICHCLSQGKSSATSQPNFRKNDLLFLRHGGLYIVMLRSICEFNRSNPGRPSRSVIVAFKNSLLEKLGLAFAEILRAARLDAVYSTGLSDLLSKKLQSELGRWIDEHCQPTAISAYQVYYSGQIYAMDLKATVYGTAEKVLNSAMARHSEKLDKAKLNWWQVPAPSLQMTESELPLPVARIGYGPHRYGFEEARNTLLGLHSQVDIYISGRKIEASVAADFKSQIEVGALADGEIDWFALNPQLFFKGKLLTKEQVSRLSAEKIIEFEGRYYSIDTREIPSVEWLNFFWNKIQTQAEKKASQGKKYEAPDQHRAEVLNLLGLRQAGVSVIGGPRWKSICSEFDALQDTGEAVVHFSKTLSPRLRSILKPYQVEGALRLSQLYRLGLGGVLADDMGLGKTVQVLSHLESLLRTQELGQTLVVVPTSLVYNWESEIEKFTPEIPYEAFDPKKKAGYEAVWQASNPLVVIATYGLMLEHGDFFKAFKWQTIIFDEAQNLKNIAASRTAVARELEAESKFCLTGTPMENHYGEFYSIMDVALPGALGTYTHFMATYGFDSSKNTLKDIEKRDIQFLKLKTKPLLLRRKKEAILAELPPKTESKIVLTFEKQQKKIYRDIAISWNDRIQARLDDGEKANVQIEMLTALLRLRQACSCPQILPDTEYLQQSPKLTQILESIADLMENGESVLIFTNFLSTLKILTEHLNAIGIENLSICGETTASARKKILQAFNESTKPSVLAMTLKTGGVGLNLTKANYVFHFEPWWNPASENQATDRVHRLGQDKPVHIYRYIMKDSVEEKIETLKIRKYQAFSALFEEGDSVGDVSYSKSGISNADFTYLLS
jgi:superfamily II DNA or RNA helicase